MAAVAATAVADRKLLEEARLGDGRVVVEKTISVICDVVL